MNIHDITERAKKHVEKDIKRRSRWTGLLLIIAAVVILEAISHVQAYYAKDGIRQEAKATAEGQLNAVRSGILNVVNQAESAVRNNVWLAQWCLQVPDSLPNMPTLIMNNNPTIAATAIALGTNSDKTTTHD